MVVYENLHDTSEVRGALNPKTLALGVFIGKLTMLTNYAADCMAYETTHLNRCLDIVMGLTQDNVYR